MHHLAPRYGRIDHVHSLVDIDRAMSMNFYNAQTMPNLPPWREVAGSCLAYLRCKPKLGSAACCVLLRIMAYKHRCRPLADVA